MSLPPRAGSSLPQARPTSAEYAGPRDQQLDLSVAGGLLDLLQRVQNGEASCLYAAKLIEILHEEEMGKRDITPSRYDEMVRLITELDLPTGRMSVVFVPDEEDAKRILEAIGIREPA